MVSLVWIFDGECLVWVFGEEFGMVFYEYVLIVSLVWIFW